MGGAAKLPLSLHEVNPYLDRFEPPIPEREFIRAIFRMDNVVMEQVMVRLAYDRPAAQSEEFKAKQKTEFGNAFYRDCINE
ncbi:hypothetical protein VO226_05470 [Halomonas elongata]|uniref:hypothetical protein n=1 Tax=Halomonas elongata TaxID=2746 RepID=UPI002E2D6498|nr:hypothetical protein [Halomonas elongata]WVI72697.1 hypothetical protein VO226_05470 [Halomonas elongata]